MTGALELRRRGWKVRLVDPGPIPHPQASSTDISKVIRVDYGADDFYIGLMDRAIDLWKSWNAKWKEELYHGSGFLVMTRGEMAPGGFEYESFAHIGKRGHALERMDSAKLRKRFPAWAAENYTEGYFNPRAGWAESGKVVARLAEEARINGVEVREGKMFRRLLEKESRVIGIETTDGEQFISDCVLVAGGAWIPAILPHLSHLMRTIGQFVVHIRVSDPSLYQPPNFSCWAADITKTGWYGFPALDDGTLKIGNHGPGVPMQPDDPVQVPEEHIAHCREFLSETFPALADAPVIATKLCRYCDSWDGDFYIDRDPDRPGLLVAAGGSGHGFKFAPVLGKIIADAVEGKPNADGERFKWRKPGRSHSEPARFLEKKN